MLGKGACQMCREGGEQGYGKQSYGLELVHVRVWLYHCYIRNRHTPASLPVFKQFVARTGCFLLSSCTYCRYLFLQP